MQIREFAERILHGTTLEEKLLTPEDLRDDVRGAALVDAPAPARPRGLEFTGSARARAAFPRGRALESDKGRGQALHFFANHELLALELMALALLRFPEAPPTFRRRLVQTMGDEQRHMGLYLGRMEELGVELGEIPLNSFFWDLLSTMETPIDFVARMSLTFEQANLDFSLHYRDAFAALGDATSAEIMNAVLEDEVAHVRHGLAFFEAWRDPKLSQWEAYQDALDFPLTPARAKGIGFTELHRKEAGLNADFIQRLRVYSHSKGRPPRVMVFNPDTEGALAAETPGHTPPASVVEMARDLETLPMYLSRPEDVVLVRKTPRPAHLKALMDAGFSLPEFVEAPLDETRLPSDHPLGSRVLEGLSPWGWDPSILGHLRPLARRLRTGAEDLDSRVDAQRIVSSKAWIAERMEAALGAIDPAVQGHCVLDPLPTVHHSLESALHALEGHCIRGHRFAVAKAPHATAGRGAQRVTVKGPSPGQTRWIEDRILREGCVVVEPWYERVADLSHLWEILADGSVREHGTTRFLTDARGRYRGTLQGPLKMGLGEDAVDFLHRSAGDPDWIRSTCRSVADFLTRQCTALEHRGNVGIDLMIVRDLQGDLKLRIPLEFNARSTMGHVALSVGRTLGPHQRALWTLWTRKDLDSAGISSFSALARRIQECVPAHGSVTVVPTNDPEWATQTLSIWTGSDSLEAIQETLFRAGLGDPTASHSL